MAEDDPGPGPLWPVLDGDSQTAAWRSAQSSAKGTSGSCRWPVVPGCSALETGSGIKGQQRQAGFPPAPASRLKALHPLARLALDQVVDGTEQNS